MKILLIGDIVGKTGLDVLDRYLSEIVKDENIDFIIANGENAADGMGIAKKEYRKMLELGIDVVTLGNHTWAKKEVFQFINEDKIIRPANYANNVPGRGYNIYECNNKKIAVINLMGRVTMNILTENPFLVADKIISKIEKECDIIIIDFHAEATAEKKALAYYLDGKVTAVFGTHTHVQTSDEQILERGTAYITDIGMTGPKESIIGMDVQTSIKRFVTTLPERYKIATGEGILNGCILEINDATCRVENIKRINR